MTLLEQLGDIAKRGVDLIEEAYAAADLPLPADHARDLRRTAEAFLAPTSHSRYQRRALACLLYTSPSPRDRTRSRMPSSA